MAQPLRSLRHFTIVMCLTVLDRERAWQEGRGCLGRCLYLRLVRSRRIAGFDKS